MIYVLAGIALAGFSGWITAFATAMKSARLREDRVVFELEAKQARAAKDQALETLRESDDRFERLLADRDSELDSLHEAISTAAEGGANPTALGDLAVAGILDMLSRPAASHDDDDPQTDHDETADGRDSEPE